MTVINTSYSTLEEAWGGNFEKPRKKKSRSMRDEYFESPVCELYQKRNSKIRKPFMEDVNPHNDLDGYMFGSHNKSQFSRTLKTPKDAGSSRSRVPSYKPVMVNDGTDEFKAEREYEDEDDEYLSKALENVSPTEGAIIPLEQFAVSKGKLDHDKMMDLGLYVVSGLLLIFAMEQILQLGIKMKA